MDPDEALRLIRLHARRLLACWDEVPSDKAPSVEQSDTLVNEGLDLARAFEALDGWLAQGGFRPAAWIDPGLARAMEQASDPVS